MLLCLKHDLFVFLQLYGFRRTDLVWTLTVLCMLQTVFMFTDSGFYTLILCGTQLKQMVFLDFLLRFLPFGQTKGSHPHEFDNFFSFPGVKSMTRNFEYFVKMTSYLNLVISTICKIFLIFLVCILKSTTRQFATICGGNKLFH